VLGENQVVLSSVSRAGAHVGVAWLEQVLDGGASSIHVQRFDGDFEPLDVSSLVIEGADSARVGSPAIASSSAGYGMGWIAEDSETGVKLSRFVEFDEQGQPGCELDLDQNPEDGLFTPRDVLTKVGGYYVLGTSDSGYGKLSLLDIEVLDKETCSIRASLDVTEDDVTGEASLARSSTRHVVAVWSQQYGPAESPVPGVGWRVLDPACSASL
jgi:hypothetical protein